jgi:hypothetical protein
VNSPQFKRSSCLAWVMTPLALAGTLTVAMFRVQHGGPLTRVDLILVGASLLVAVSTILAVRWWRRPQNWLPVTAICQRCGYDLQQSPLPRCPECGALIGFKKSAEELGVTPHDFGLSSLSESDSDLTSTKYPSLPKR